MRDTSDISKLEELRAKTDRELLMLVSRELERGLALARVAAGQGSAMHLQAEAALAEVRILLPKLAGLNGEMREKLESKVRELRRELDAAPLTTSWISAPTQSPNPGAARRGIGLHVPALGSGSA
jgi:hypothetical protein